MAKAKVKPISFRDQDELLYTHLCSQPNVSKYVRELIKRDLETVTLSSPKERDLLLEIRDLILELKEKGVAITEHAQESQDNLYDAVLNLINFD